MTYVDNVIKSGAQGVQIFDSTAGELPYSEYMNASLQYILKLAKRIKNLHPNIPLILFVKGNPTGLKMAMEHPYFDAISIDHTADIQEFKDLAKKHNKVLQGNLEPGVLLGIPEIIEKKTMKMIDSFGLDG